MIFNQILLVITATLLVLSVNGWMFVEELRKNGGKAKKLEKKSKGGKDERTPRV